MRKVDKWEDRKLQLLTNWERYKSQIYCWDRDQITDDGSDFNVLKAELNTSEKTFIEVVHNIRTQDQERNLLTLERALTSLMDYMKFSGQDT